MTDQNPTRAEATSTSSTASTRKCLEHGYGLLRDGRLTEALEFAADLLSGHPRDSHVLDFAAEAHLANNAPLEALAMIDRAIACADDPFLKIKKARLLPLLRRRNEILPLAAEIAAQAAGNGGLLWQLGKLYYRNNYQSEAIEQYERARVLIGDHPGLLYDMAVARFFSGDFEQAEHDLDRTLVAAPQSGPALYLRATLRRQTRNRNHVEDIKRRLKNSFRSAADEGASLFALAKELEDLGEHEASFTTLVAGARKMRSTLVSYDIEAECASLQAIQDAYTAEVMAQPLTGCEDSGAIFIVGMPRTGTTLAERLLVQSGKVTAAGELLDFGNLLAAATHRALSTHPALTPASASLSIDFAALGRDYMLGIPHAASISPYFIDKMPINYLYCGMIRKALPNARIIHLIRDPLDTCYAVFKTLFFNSYSFSYDLDELGKYYIAYHRMMRHWHEVMPDQILDVHYEDLVTDTEIQCKRIYDWCGLAWQPSLIEAPIDDKVFATASAAQVREPVHNRSVGSSRRHAHGLTPLIKRLTSGGIDLRT